MRNKRQIAHVRDDELRSIGDSRRCSGEGGAKECLFCHAVRYCGDDCRVDHWREHRPVCTGKPSAVLLKKAAAACGAGLILLLLSGLPFVAAGAPEWLSPLRYSGSKQDFTDRFARFFERNFEGARRLLSPCFGAGHIELDLAQLWQGLTEALPQGLPANLVKCLGKVGGY